MKIRITEHCECCFKTPKMEEIEDCGLKEGTILQGEKQDVVNWEGKPMPAIDLIGPKKAYLGIPDDCFEVLEP